MQWLEEVLREGEVVGRVAMNFARKMPRLGPHEGAGRGAVCLGRRTTNFLFIFFRVFLFQPLPSVR